MTHGDSLFLTVESTHRRLQERLDEALAPHRDPDRPRDGHSSTDAFLAATSRHFAAVEAVLLPTLCPTVPDGDVLAKQYVLAARHLERTLSLVKARAYGEAHAVHMSWSGLWSLAKAQLTEHNRLELELVDKVIEHDDPELMGAELALVCRGQRWTVGSFLGAEERAALAEALRGALREARTHVPSV